MTLTPIKLLALSVPPAPLLSTFTITFICAGFNVDIRASFAVKEEGWTDITRWRAVGVAHGLHKADAGIISNSGRFLSSQEGVLVYLDLAGIRL